jgi:hypothetical protein
MPVGTIGGDVRAFAISEICAGLNLFERNRIPETDEIAEEMRSEVAFFFALLEISPWQLAQFSA